MSMKNEARRRTGRKKSTAPSGAHLDVVDIMRERIANHTIPPGAKLLEQDVAREFGLSRARVREVLSALELRGLIRRELNRGAIVTKLELSQVFEIYDTREVLEGLCFRLATQNVPPETWDELVKLFGKPLERMVAAGDINGYQQAYSQMRGRVIDAAGNQILVGMLDSVYEKTRIIMRRVMILPGRVAKGLKENQAVLAAMRRGDAYEAERLKRANIRSAIDDLKRYQDYVF